MRRIASLFLKVIDFLRDWIGYSSFSSCNRIESIWGESIYALFFYRIVRFKALEHAWIRGENVSHAPLSDIVRHMESFNNRRRLRFSEFSLAAPLISLMRSTSMSAAARAVLSISGEGNRCFCGSHVLLES